MISMLNHNSMLNILEHLYENEKLLSSTYGSW